MGDYAQDLNAFVKGWKEAEQRVVSRRQLWKEFVDKTLNPRLHAVAQALTGAGILAHAMDRTWLGMRRVGLRIDTRNTGLTYREAQAEHALHEEFADFGFEQRPSGLIWVLRWQPYIKELAVEEPMVMLARDFDPADLINETKILDDITGFLKWALEKSYRGDKPGLGMQNAAAVKGFGPGE